MWLFSHQSDYTQMGNFCQSFMNFFLEYFNVLCNLTENKCLWQEEESLCWKNTSGLLAV